MQDSVECRLTANHERLVHIAQHALSGRGLFSFAAPLSRLRRVDLFVSRQNHYGHRMRSHLHGSTKINFSTVFAGQNLGVKQIADRIWLVSFIDYDLGFFDDETCRLEPAENPFQAKVLPMSPV